MIINQIFAGNETRNMKDVIREITPLNRDDLFILLNNRMAKFDYPIHFHSEYELNMVFNTSGKRFVGDSVENFEEFDLILLGSNLPHKWKAPTQADTHVITIQFDDKIVDSFLLGKRLFNPIKDMLIRSSRGLDFSHSTKMQIKDKLINLSQSHGFTTALDFYSILYELATSQGQRYLSSLSFDTSSVIRESKSRRIDTICKYIELNFAKDISLSEAAGIVAMSESSFSHFFKKRTNRNFISYLNDVRIGNATKILLETSNSMAEISFMCGFSNISNFNRIFKKIKGQTPSEYRTSIQQILTKF
jgi:AraC-like DNA-binding protein